MKHTNLYSFFFIILSFSFNTVQSAAGPFQPVWLLPRQAQSPHSAPNKIKKNPVPSPPAYADSVEKSIELPPDPLHMGAIYLAWLNHEKNLKEVVHTGTPNDVLCDQMGLDSSMFPADAQFNLTDEQLEQVKKREERLLSVAQFGPNVETVTERIYDSGQYIEKHEQALSFQPPKSNTRDYQAWSAPKKEKPRKIGSLYGFLTVKNLDRVTVLLLQGQRLRKFPVEVGAALVLTKQMNLAHNQLSEPPLQALQAMPCLEELDLGFNPFHTLKRDAITGLDKLKVLNLFKCGPLAELDNACITNLPELTKVDLSCNNIDCLKLDFPTLGKLDEIEAMYNNVSYLPHNSFWRENTTPLLTRLCLHGNNILLRKGTFSSFPNLKRLTLSLNGSIDVIPKDAFAELAALTYLRLGDCKIHTIERGGLNGLRSLEEFNFYDNEYQHLTGGIFGRDLRNLKKICFRENPIGKIDEEALQDLNQLPNLTSVSFRGSASHVTAAVKKVLPRDCNFW